MPNRILRDGIVDSRRIASLSEPALVLYYKLFAVVDDYGRYEADPELLRLKLFPWNLERVSKEDVAARLRECASGDEPLVLVYAVGKKTYLQIENFKQQRRSKSKFVPPPGVTDTTDRNQLIADDISCNQLQTAPSRIVSTRIESSSSPTNTETAEEKNSAPKPQLPASVVPISGRTAKAETAALVVEEPFAYIPAFELLWDEYPAIGRNNRQMAFGVFVTKIDQGSSKASRFEEMRCGLERWKVSARWRRPSGIKDMANWLSYDLFLETPMPADEAEKLDGAALPVGRKDVMAEARAYAKAQAEKRRAS